MLTQGAAMRFAEAAAGFLPRREPKEWLTRALLLRTEDGEPAVLGRTEAIAVLEKTRAHAKNTDQPELERDIAAGIDVIKAAAPVEVPVIVFLEVEGEVSFGVFTLGLPGAARTKPGKPKKG
jgi:hypothetical protein